MGLKSFSADHPSGSGGRVAWIWIAAAIVGVGVDGKRMNDFRIQACWNYFRDRVVRA